MFVLDTSLSCIEADEADVIEIHRSDDPVPAAPGDLPSRPCNAYVCAVKRQEKLRVAVALEQTDRKKTFVYLPDREPSAGESPARLVREALAFAAGLGFTMREVNLKYGKAMREVVIRDIRVICRPAVTAVMDEAVIGKVAPPLAKEKAAHPSREEAPKPAAKKEPTGERTVQAERMAAEAERLAAEKTSAEAEWAETQARLAAEIERLAAEKDEFVLAAATQERGLRAEVERLAGEKSTVEQEAAERLKPLEKEAKKLAAEVEVLRRAAEPGLTRLRDEIARLGAEKERAGEAVAREEGELKVEAERLQGEIERLQSEAQRLAAARDDAQRQGGERIMALTAELDAISAAGKGAEESATARIAELEANLARLAADSAAAADRLATDIAALEEELVQRTAARDAARQEAIERLARLVAEAELVSAERSAVERVIAGKGSGAVEMLAKAEAEMVALREEVERLAIAKTLAEQSAATRVAQLQAEMERLAAERPAAIPAVPKRELRDVGRVSSQDYPSESGPSVSVPQRGTPPPPAVRERVSAPPTAGWDKEAKKAAGALPLEKGEGGEDPFAFMGSDDGFVSFGAPGPAGTGGAGGMFRLEKGLDCIEYGGPEDIVELHQTLNMVSISPEGHVPQSCGAYICALRRGKGFRVYVAWTLEADRKTLVYSPEKQPASAEECSLAIGDAFEFVETVGFMMDEVHLPSDPEKRARALAKMPVLCRKG